MLSTSVVWKVMFGAALLGAAAAFVGTFAVLRRRALLGDMLSHAALPGIATAFMLWHTRDMLVLSLGALVAGLAGVAAVAAMARWTRTSEDAALGIVLSTFFGAGVVMLTVLQSDPQGNKAGLDSYLFGEIASLRSRDVALIAGVAAVVVVFVLAVYKELKVLAFDTGFAAAQGWPTFWLDLAVMAAVAVVTIIGLPICGVVLMAAMLITPPAAARFWTNRFGRLLGIAAVFGALTGVLGCLVAAPQALAVVGLPEISSRTASGLPPGPMIVLSGAALLLVSLLLAPERGVVARLWGERRLRLRIVRDHLLRALYEVSPAPEIDRPWVSFARLSEHTGQPPAAIRWAVRHARWTGMVDRDGDRLRFTPEGYQVAAQVVRTHRLWEMYMMEDWNRSPTQVHHDADAVEHLLPADAVERLEELLQAQGRWPAIDPGSVPRSPHALRGR